MKLLRYYAPPNLSLFELQEWVLVTMLGGFEDARRLMLKPEDDLICVEWMLAGYHYEAKFSQHMLPHFIRVLGTKGRAREALVSVNAVFFLNMGKQEERTFQ